MLTKDRHFEDAASVAPASPTLFTIYFLLLTGVAGLVVALLIHDGKKLGIPIALVTGATIMLAERFGERSGSVSPDKFRVLPHFVPAVVIGSVVFALYLPTLSIPFLTDDFGCLHAFHHASLHQFLRMFHTDLAQVVEGESGQEIRPFYALFFMLGYKLFRLNPHGYHLLGVIFHLLNSLLVYAIAEKICRGRRLAACVAALLFCMQPAHAWSVSWITGTPAELIPTFFYLCAFYCFVLFRSGNDSRYWVLSIVSFAGCLVSKEMTVTLPGLCLAYDLFQHFRPEGNVAAAGSTRPGSLGVRQLTAYVPFAVLLTIYLEWRRFVFAHALGENFWAESLGVQARARGHGFSNFIFSIADVIRYLLSHHAGNIRSLLVSSPRVAAGIAAGLLAAWGIDLWRQRLEFRDSIAWVVFFGVGWYFIADLPLLVAAFEPRHLYLVSVGPCIAIALVIFPNAGTASTGPSRFRYAAAAILMGVLAFQLCNENAKIRVEGEVYAKAATQLNEISRATPRETLVLIPLRQRGLLPFALQVPFSVSDLYSPLPIIEYPEMCDCPFPLWRAKTQTILETFATNPSSNFVDVELVAWNEAKQSVQATKTRLSSGSIRSAVKDSTGKPPQLIGTIDKEAGMRLMDALVGTASGEK